MSLSKPIATPLAPPAGLGLGGAGFGSSRTPLQRLQHKLQQRQAAAAKAVTHVSEVPTPPKKKAKVSHDVVPHSHSSPPAAVSGGESAQLERTKSELVSISRHFSKIAQRYTFDNNTASYMRWVIQFAAEMDSYEMEELLTSDPRSLPESLSVSELSLQRLRQKTLYHMLLQCVPADVRSVVTITLPPEQHTAYDAWEALRLHYIGDKNAYLQSLENRFNRFKWEDNEEWPAFETRYESLLSELHNAGVPKLDHVKRSGLMNAVQESNKRDVRSNHVFDRLNIISKINLNASF
jgi:hypothetical protein